MSKAILLPWPAQELRPNRSVHWARLSTARKHQKETAFWLAKEAKLFAPAGPLRVRLDAYPKHERRRDKDNLIASCKAALDGIAQAIGVDDSLFDPVCVIHPADGRGVIEITVEAI